MYKDFDPASWMTFFMARISSSFIMCVRKMLGNVLRTKSVFSVTSTDN